MRGGGVLGVLAQAKATLLYEAAPVPKLALVELPSDRREARGANEPAGRTLVFWHCQPLHLNE